MTYEGALGRLSARRSAAEPHTPARAADRRVGPHRRSKIKEQGLDRKEVHACRQYRSIGGEPQVVEIPTPEPGPGQIRLRVTAAGLRH